MFYRKTVFSLGMAMALGVASAIAAGAEHEQHHPGPDATAPTRPEMPMRLMPENSGMPMPSMMQMMMGENGMSSHVEGRIAFIKAELKITDAQQPLWKAVADAMRSNAKAMAELPNHSAMTRPGNTLPDELATQEKMMAAHLDGLHKLRSALAPLYAALSPDQKTTADQLMVSPIGMTGMCKM